MLPIHTILHATDFSPQSNHAYQLACALARDYEAKLVLLHVAPPPVIGGEMGVIIPPEPVDWEEELREKLAELQPKETTIPVERYLREGDPALEIVALAQDCQADLIVLGTHGRSGLGRLLLGSVAEAVLRKAPCPVLTVKVPVMEPAKKRPEATAAAH